MTDDPIAGAREAVERAQAAARDTPEAAAPLLHDALDQIAKGLKLLAVQQALLDERLLRVERNRLFSAYNRVVSAGTSLWRRAQPNSPEADEDPAEYATWVRHELAALPSAEAARAVGNSWAHRPTISVIIAVRSAEAAAECLAALGGQVYGNWELCVAVNKSSESCLSGFPGAVRSVGADSLDGTAALNAAAALASGDYLAFVEESGILSLLALHYVAEAAQEGSPDIIYSDEDSLDSTKQRVRPRFKPDWSPELLTSSPYLGNLLCIRRESFLRAGGLSKESGDAPLFDLALRMADGPVRVHHIPRVLYHDGGPGPALNGAAEAIVRAIGRREQVVARCVPGPAAHTWMIRRKRDVVPTTAIVCSRSPKLLETCLAYLRATAERTVRQVVVVAHEQFGRDADLHEVIQAAGATALSFQGAFDFSAMNNLGAAKATSPHLLFLNDDVRATEPEWAELLSEQVSREAIGIAGSVLWYPEGVLQHAGVVAGIGDGVGHAGRHQSASRLWPWLLATREVSAVTGACLAIRKEVFERLGGFDARFPNNYNDVDLCFRARLQGYQVICVPAAGLIHSECQSRPGIVRFDERYRFYERWAEVLRSPDPYYSRSLAPSEKIALNLNGDDWYRELLGG